MVGIQDVIEIKTDQVTFYVAGNKIAIETGLQFLLFSPINKYHVGRLRRAQENIICGETTTIIELIEDMEGVVMITPGNKSWIYNTYNKAKK